MIIYFDIYLQLINTNTKHSERKPMVCIKDWKTHNKDTKINKL